MKRGFLAVFCAANLTAAGLSAADIRFSPEFTSADLARLAEALGDLLAFPNLTSAQASGLVGFQVLGAVGGVQASRSESWWRHSLGREATWGVLPAPRLLVRKGLPGRFDVGAQTGVVAGERFLGGELRWSLSNGGVVLPAVALSASFSRLQHQVLDFRVGELKFVVSKGFVLLTPFGGIGISRHEAKALFGEPMPFWHKVDGGGASAFAGVVFHPLPLLRLIAEARRGAFTSYFLALGVGL